MDLTVFYGFLVQFILLDLAHSESKTLKMVNVVFRHGARTPVTTFPTDENTEDTWPQGFGQLTITGMKQQYELGTFFKKRYINDTKLLDSSYDRFQIRVRSTDVDRTLMSAETDLAGLYPPHGKQVWNTELPWQPIPVHTMPGEDDLWLNEKSKCPEYDALQNQSLKGDEYIKMSKKYKDFLDDINEKTGYNGTINVSNIYLVYDPLKIERESNRSLPDWATAEVMSTLSLLMNYSIGQLFDPPSKNRLRGGALVGLILQNIANFTNSTTPSDQQTRFFMYSGHDTTIVAFTSALGVWNGLAPTYASAVGIELWEDENNQSFIEMWYRNDTSRDPYPLSLEKCNLSCPLEEFIRQTKHVAVKPADIRAQCGLEWSTDYLLPMILGVALAVMLILFLAWYCVCSGVRKRSTGHLRLQNEDIAYA